mgnify:CR=1 FL=1
MKLATRCGLAAASSDFNRSKPVSPSRSQSRSEAPAPWPPGAERRWRRGDAGRGNGAGAGGAPVPEGGPEVAWAGAWAGVAGLAGLAGVADVVDGVVTNPLAHAVMTALHLAGARTREDVAELSTELYRATAAH